MRNTLEKVLSFLRSDFGLNDPEGTKKYCSTLNPEFYLSSVRWGFL